MLIIRLKALRIEITVLFLCLITFFLLVDKTGITEMSLIATACHELGHIIAFILCKYKIKNIRLDLTGVTIEKPKYVLSLKKELFVETAGVFVNFVIYFVILALNIKDSKLLLFSYVNLSIGLFNLLPIKTLDGSKILEVLFCKIKSENIKYNLINFFDFVSFAFLVFLSFYSIYITKSATTLVVYLIVLLLTGITKINNEIILKKLAK